MKFLVMESISDFFAKLWESITNYWLYSSTDTPYLYSVIAALIWALISYLLINIVLKIARKGMKMSKFRDKNRAAKNFFFDVIKICLTLGAFIVFLALLRVDMSGMSTVLSSAIVAIGLSLQGLVGNFASGLIILSSHFFDIGDYISIKDNAEGIVINVRFLYTILQTIDGQQVMISNSTVAGSVITNYSTNPTRRMNIALTFAYKEDPNIIRKDLLKIVKTEKQILDDPKPVVVVNNLDTNGVTYNLRCYTNTTDYWNIYYSINEKIVNELQNSKLKVQSVKVEFISADLVERDK